MSNSTACPTGNWFEMGQGPTSPNPLLSGPTTAAAAPLPKLSLLEHLLSYTYAALFLFGETGNGYVISIVIRILCRTSNRLRQHSYHHQHSNHDDIHTLHQQRSPMTSRSHDISTTSPPTPSHPLLPTRPPRCDVIPASIPTTRSHARRLTTLLNNQQTQPPCKPPRAQKHRGGGRPNRHRSSASFVYILCLSSVDALVLAFLPFVISDMVTRSWTFGPAMCKLYLASDCFAKLLSTYLLTLLSASRFFSVVPQASRTIHGLFGGIAIAGLLIDAILICLIAFYANTVSVSFQVPRLVKAKSGPVELASAHSATQISLFTAVQSSPGPSSSPLNHSTFSQHAAQLSLENSSKSSSFTPLTLIRCHFDPPTAIQNYFVLTIFTAGYLVPGLLIGTFYAGLIARLRAQTRRFRSSRLDLWKVSRPIALVAALYYTCWTPYWLLAVVFNHFVGSGEINGNATASTAGGQGHQESEEVVKNDRRILLITTMIIHVLPYLNSACNPILYAWFNTELRRAHAATSLSSHSLAAAHSFIRLHTKLAKPRKRSSMITGTQQQSSSSGRRRDSLLAAMTTLPFRGIRMSPQGGAPQGSTSSVSSSPLTQKAAGRMRALSGELVEMLTSRLSRTHEEPSSPSTAGQELSFGGDAIHLQALRSQVEDELQEGNSSDLLRLNKAMAIKPRMVGSVGVIQRLRHRSHSFPRRRAVVRPPRNRHRHGKNHSIIVRKISSLTLTAGGGVTTRRVPSCTAQSISQILSLSSTSSTSSLLLPCQDSEQNYTTAWPAEKVSHRDAHLTHTDGTSLIPDSSSTRIQIACLRDEYHNIERGPIRTATGPWFPTLFLPGLRRSITLTPTPSAKLSSNQIRSTPSSSSCDKNTKSRDAVVSLSTIRAPVPGPGGTSNLPYPTLDSGNYRAGFTLLKPTTISTATTGGAPTVLSGTVVSEQHRSPLSPTKAASARLSITSSCYENSSYCSEEDSDGKEEQ